MRSRPEDLHYVINERYDKGSILLASNRSPAEWPDLFGDPLLPSAGLDRLADRAEKLVIRGESYRAQGCKNLIGPAYDSAVANAVTNLESRLQSRLQAAEEAIGKAGEKPGAKGGFHAACQATEQPCRPASARGWPCPELARAAMFSCAGEVADFQAATSTKSLVDAGSGIAIPSSLIPSR